MTKPLKRTAVEELCEGIGSFFEIQEYKDIIEFALNDIDLSDDVSSARDKIDLEHYPYLVEPLKSCMIEEGVRKEVVLAFPEQMSKTTVEMISILWNCCFNSLQCIIVYPSVDLAVETSQTKFLPLFRKIDQFKEDIEKPFAIRGDRLKLSNALIYWQGAGTKVVSKSAKLVLGDECAVWQNPPNVNNINELKKRTRSYSESLAVFVSTPSYKENPFWVEFLEGSQSYYTLRCQSCGELTMRSCDVRNLQFETTYNEELLVYQPVVGSCRMVCPKCGHEHEESQRQRMIAEGAYVPLFPDKVATRPSFQCGVLASMLNVHSWDNVAEQQLKSGSTAELSDYVGFDNSIRGLPYQERDYNAQGETALAKLQYEEVPKDGIEAILLAADTQDAFSVLGRFALTRDNELYLIDIHRPRYLWLAEDERKVVNRENQQMGKAPEKTVLDWLDEEVCGMRPMMLLVDRQGHRQDEVSAFSRMRRNIIMYSGTALKYDTMKPSDSIPKMFLFNEKTFRAELIFKLYHDKSHSLKLPSDLPKDDVDEIVCVQPDKEHRNGSLYENWQPLHNETHDVFDTLKMGLCAVKLAAVIFKGRFKYNEAKCLNPLGKEQAAKKPQKPRPSAPRHGLFGR